MNYDLTSLFLSLILISSQAFSISTPCGNATNCVTASSGGGDQGYPRTICSACVNGYSSYLAYGTDGTCEFLIQQPTGWTVSKTNTTGALNSNYCISCHGITGANLPVPPDDVALPVMPANCGYSFHTVFAGVPKLE